MPGSTGGTLGSMAKETMDRVRALQQGVLEPGEFFTAATRVRWKTGMLRFLGPIYWAAAASRRKNPKQAKLPLEGIWAVTDRRLLVFNSDRARRLKPTTLVASFPLGDEAHLVELRDPAKALGAGDHWTYLTVHLGDQTIEVEAPEAEAIVFADALRRNGPGRTEAPAAHG